MVSSQETQRALLTPGEVMQLPDDDELVMVSGVRPIRAKKLRYFEDRNFTSRVEPAASTSNPPPGSEDDWTGVVAPPVIDSASARSLSEASDEGGHEHKLSFDPPTRPSPEVNPEISPEEAPDTDDFDDVARNGLKPAQRALGLEQGGNDALPDF
jgi:type IV secretion system protein VirD4